MKNCHGNCTAFTQTKHTRMTERESSILESAISSSRNFGDTPGLVAKNHFVLAVQGEIESGNFPYFDEIYCKYSLVCGPDWNATSGGEEGISQIARRGYHPQHIFVWNLPFNAIYKTTNPSGWPQLVISTYGLDVFGNEVVRGYGVTHIPLQPGRSSKKVAMFVPESTTLVQQFTSWLTGKRPEFADHRILTQGDARGVVRVKSQGFVHITFDVTTRGLHSLGYQIK